MPVALMTALALAQSAPLPATLPERFYNRPGASVTTRDADLARCLAIATQPMADIGPAVVKDRRLTPPVGTAQDGPPIPPDGRAFMLAALVGGYLPLTLPPPPYVSSRPTPPSALTAKS